MARTQSISASSVLERSFIARSFSFQMGKGTTAARECCRRLVRRKAIRQLGVAVFDWYQFSREGDSLGLRRCYARTESAASRIAAIIELGRAIPFPAISKAVPWSGEVRTNGRPSVTFTPWSKAWSFSGMSP